MAFNDWGNCAALLGGRLLNHLHLPADTGVPIKSSNQNVGRKRTYHYISMIYIESCRDRAPSNVGNSVSITARTTRLT
jgi:hypothetical protein